MRLKITGRVRGSNILPRGKDAIWCPATPWVANTHMYDLATAAAALFCNLQDGRSYSVNGMYIEFDNSGAAVDPVPVIELSDGYDYFTGLTGDSDFLRIPLMARGLGTVTDADKFPRGTNTATFSARTTGTTGMRDVSPLTFSDAAGSRVYGGALVAMRSAADITQDLVVARFYFEPANQIAKAAGQQIGLDWPLTFDWTE
jgi:hypothetical protein